MSQQKKITSLERKLLSTYHQDGILDLVSGVVILIFAVVALYDQAGFIGMMAIPGTLYIPIKQRITYPRLGYVRFESAKEEKKKLSLGLVAGIAAFLGLLVFYFSIGSVSFGILSLFRENIVYIFGAVLGMLLVALGYFLKIPRFYGYAVIGAVLVWFSGYFSIDIVYGIAVLGSIMIAAGITLLVRFLRSNPVQKKNAS